MKKTPYKPSIGVTELEDTAIIAFYGALNFITDTKFVVHGIDIQKPYVQIDMSKALDVDVQGCMVVEQLVKMLLAQGKESVKIIGNAKCVKYIFKAELKDNGRIDLADFLVEKHHALTFTNKRTATPICESMAQEEIV